MTPAGSALRILLHTAGADAGEWHAALAGALPEAEVRLWPDVAADTDYLAVWKPPPELFARAPGARAIFNLGAGVDALLRVPTLPAAIPVIRLEDAGMAEQMADYVALAVLGAYRRQRAYAEQQREGVWRQWPHRRKQDFGVGMMGLGVLGMAAARQLAGLGFPLAGWRREHGEVAAMRAYAGVAELPAFLARSQALVCLLPATPDTRGLLDRTRLFQLPRGAHLVNVSRGDAVVDADLIAALDAGHLASATLDVFHEEPLPPAHPFWGHPRVTLTPHVSAITLIEESVAQVAAKIRRLQQGLPVTGVVDRDRGY